MQHVRLLSSDIDIFYEVAILVSYGVIKNFNRDEPQLPSTISPTYACASCQSSNRRLKHPTIIDGVLPNRGTTGWQLISPSITVIFH